MVADVAWSGQRWVPGEREDLRAIRRPTTGRSRAEESQQMREGPERGEYLAAKQVQFWKILRIDFLELLCGDIK